MRFTLGSLVYGNYHISGLGFQGIKVWALKSHHSPTTYLLRNKLQTAMYSQPYEIEKLNPGTLKPTLRLFETYPPI